MTSTVFKPFLSSSYENGSVSATTTDLPSPQSIIDPTNSFQILPHLLQKPGDFNSFYNNGSAFAPLQQNGVNRATNFWPSITNGFSPTNPLLNPHLNPFLAAALLARQYGGNKDGNCHSNSIFGVKDASKPSFINLSALNPHNSRLSTLLLNKKNLNDETDSLDANGNATGGGLLNSSTTATSDGASTPPTSL